MDLKHAGKGIRLSKGPGFVAYLLNVKSKITSEYVMQQVAKTDIQNVRVPATWEGKCALIPEQNDHTIGVRSFRNYSMAITNLQIE